MKLAILGSTESWHVNDLRRAAEGRHEILPVTFRDVSASVCSGKIDVSSRPAKSQCNGRRPEREFVDLSQCDAVLVRTMPAGSLEQVVFRMDALTRLEARGLPILNPPKAIETAVDKFLTTARLAEAGLCVPRTITCQTVDDALDAFEALDRDVVVKPIFGGEGRGITHLNDEALAHRAFSMLEKLGAVLYVQEFIEHEGVDLRLFVVGDSVLGMRRVSTTDWRTNISRGATAERLDIEPELKAIAHRAALAVGAPLAGVDLLPARDGRLLALEVNAVPGWQALTKTLQTDVAALILEQIEAMADGVASGPK